MTPGFVVSRGSSRVAATVKQTVTAGCYGIPNTISTIPAIPRADIGPGYPSLEGSTYPPGVGATIDGYIQNRTSPRENRGDAQKPCERSADMTIIANGNGKTSNPPPDWVLALQKKPFEKRSAGSYPEDNDPDVQRRLDELQGKYDAYGDEYNKFTAEHGGARPGAGRKKGDPSSATTSEGREKRKADRDHARDWAVEYMIRSWDRTVTIHDKAAESFGYLEGHGWRRLATGTLQDRADDALRKQKARSTVATRNEVLTSWRIRTKPSCLQEIIHDDENRSWDLETGKPVPGVPWQNVVVHVTAKGKLTTTPATRDVFSRRASVAAEFIGRVEEPPAYFAQALSDWGITGEDEVVYVGAVIGLCLAEIAEPHGMLTLVGVGGSGKSTFIKIVAGLAGGAAAATTPASLAGKFGTWPLMDRRLLAITDAPNDTDPDTRKGLATIKALSGGDAIWFEQKGGLVYERTWPGRVIWASNFPGRWGDGAADYEAWERRLLPIPMPIRVGGNKIADFGKVVLEKERNELASWAITSLSEWLGNGHPIPPRMRATRTKLLQAGKSPATLFALMHLAPGDTATRVTREEVWGRYLEVAENEGWGVDPKDLIAVSKAVTERGKALNPDFRVTRNRVITGNPDSDNPAETKVMPVYWGIRLTDPDAAG